MLSNLILIAVLMLALWLISLVRRDASIVDPFWGLGFAIVAWFTYWQAPCRGERGYLLLGLVTLWGLRLSGHLLRRNWGHGEDRRYRALREKYGSWFPLISLGLVFLLQAFLLWVVSWPVQSAILRDAPVPWNWQDALGIGLWSVGMFFEVVGDWQLARFLADPQNAGQVLQTGLWRYTRHPNYFGECCLWWGHALIAAAGQADGTLISPVLMTFLLLKVSGVSLLESTLSTRRPAYLEYAQRTNTFFPGPPKR